MPTFEELQVASLGPCEHDSPLPPDRGSFIDDEERVVLSPRADELSGERVRNGMPRSFEVAGPRRHLFFSPQSVSCGVVSCGGLCPGLNNVIRSIVLTLTYVYGVRRIIGFRYGYAGLTPEPPATPITLTPELVESIHESGGTLLGSSRGPQDVVQMVETLQAQKVDMLIAIGGDGTFRGARAVQSEITRRRLPIAVVGVPKTIDNDLRWTERSFGFVTAVEEAGHVLAAAHAEARGAWNGVGLVKLMGRHSGFIAAHAALGNADVNFCLVPEVPLELDGEGGFLCALLRRLRDKRHAVVVVAEGAGQGLMRGSGPVGHDVSGNVRLRDIGVFLRECIVRHSEGNGYPVTVRYVDPSYTIRSAPANMFDAEFCLRLGQHAVHAAMAGRTNIFIGYWNQHFTHAPISLAVSGREHLDTRGDVWRSVLDATGQPATWSARDS